MSSKHSNHTDSHHDHSPSRTATAPNSTDTTGGQAHHYEAELHGGPASAAPPRPAAESSNGREGSAAKHDGVRASADKSSGEQANPGFLRDTLRRTSKGVRGAVRSFRAAFKRTDEQPPAAT